MPVQRSFCPASNAISTRPWPLASVQGESEQHGELISYLFFDPEFHKQAIALGRDDAERWLKRVHGPDAPWYAEPIDALRDS
jgi:hypothetical protein